MAQIQAEGVRYLRTVLPRHIERVAFRALGAVAIVALAILTWGYFHQQDQIRDAVIFNCETNRILISRIVLRSAGATFDDYERNPQRVLRLYRRQLAQIDLYKQNPILLDQVIARTSDTLKDADPDDCASITKFRVDRNEKK